jgi:hypothetical protein
VTVTVGGRSRRNPRSFGVDVDRDPLDDWTVTIKYGRAGKGGRELRYAASEADAIRAIVRDRLRRRLSAPKRIGCSERSAAFSAAPGLDASSWLHGVVMAKFFKPV